jgi:hypothetical protein
MDHSAHEPQAVTPAPNAGSGRRRPWRAALLMVALIAAFFLLREHWNHVAGAWPYLLLLACPLMHLFHGHGGHGRHHGSKSGQE